MSFAIFDLLVNPTSSKPNEIVHAVNKLIAYGDRLLIDQSNFEHAKSVLFGHSYAGVNNEADNNVAIQQILSPTPPFLTRVDETTFFLWILLAGITILILVWFLFTHIWESEPSFWLRKFRMGQYKTSVDSELMLMDHDRSSNYSMYMTKLRTDWNADGAIFV